jgi:hypothetical protein
MTNRNEKLVFNKLDKVYCRLAPSPIHGVGIFAIKKIPLGINPFNSSYMAQEGIVIDKSKLESLGPEILKMLDDYHPSNDSQKQFLSNFPNQPIWTNYLNYSDKPNIQLMEDGEWKTLRIIEKGEELLEDPKRLFNKDGSHKIFKVHSMQYPNLRY